MPRLGRVESWAMSGPDPDNPWSSWRGGLCERTGPSLFRVAGLSRKKRKSEIKRHSAAVWGILPPHPAAWCYLSGAEGPEPTPEVLGRVCTSGSPKPTPETLGRVRASKGPKSTSKAPGRVCTMEGLCSHPYPQGECVPKPAGPEAAGEVGWRLAKSQTGTQKSKTKPPSACCSQKDQQN